ncbi:bifunctional folylpolyglutamate synthase/dihydrofolate synthase [Occallatibacter savannae]|uniref:bifunctional folylpolyglutamate synthase/dihydrofolate synthase n=1 Tax=Occallatibacter savannae TaxID=1002691 RepID=UPI000D696DEF|nr:folylpolyglutamate synthase/dihydrofolate synthase family protein [Occallatibacter savannae]
MSYQSAIDHLAAMAPELATQTGQPRRKFSLDEIGTLLAALGNPHRTFPSVLIAGTNGKGSTASTLWSILTSSGLRTGLYTSPHLSRPNERIRIDGVEIADEDFASTFFRVRSTAQRLVDEGKLAQAPSFFEVLTAMAFLHFAEPAIEIAVLEVGMGGRLDATNIVDPLISIITDISLDHMEWLGPTISDIAREKAGIMRHGGTLVTLPQHPEANQVIGEVATSLSVLGVSAVPFLPAGEAPGRAELEPVQSAYNLEVLGKQIEVDSPLRGSHQHRNVALAIAAAVELAISHGFPITAKSIADGIRNTRWPGRLERVTTPAAEGAATLEWILDVAHNPAGAWALRAGLRKMLPNQQLGTLVFSCLRDKPVAEMAQILFPIFERVIFAPIYSSRATPMRDLMAAAASTGTNASAAASVGQAIDLAIEQTRERPGTPIVVSGSVYLVGDVRTRLLARQAQSVSA